MLKNKHNRTKILSLVISLVFLAFSLASCGASDKAYSGEASNDMAMDIYDGSMSSDIYPSGSDSIKYSAEYEKTEAESGSSASGSASAPNPLEGRKIIKTVNITAETLTFEDTLAKLEADVAALGGYVQSSNSYGKSYEHYSDRRATYTVRIPAERLDEFVYGIEGSSNVISKTSKVDDITDTYTDIEARLSALRTEETRLLELLSQSGSLHDLLEIESKLSNVRYEIERYTATLKGYNTLIAFSTVNITISEVIEYTPEPIKAPTFGQRISKAFSESWEEFADGCRNFAVGFVYSFPTLLVLAVITAAIVIFIKAMAKRARRRRMERYQQNMQSYVQNQSTQQNQSNPQNTDNTQGQ